MEPATEATEVTRLLQDLSLSNNNNNKQSPEKLSSSQQLENVFATIFTAGWYAWSHSQAFDRAVATRQLEDARFHLIKGAKVNLDNPNVTKVVTERQSSPLKTFLVVNASSGNSLGTFQALIDQEDWQNAKLMAKEAPISLASRIAIFDWAMEQKGKAAQIAKEILGTSARLLVRIAKAVDDYSLDKLLPEIAQSESSCPFTRLHPAYPNHIEVAWENSQFVLHNYAWHADEAPTLEQWQKSLLRRAIFWGNIPLAREQLNHMTPNEIPARDYLLDATQNSKVAEQTRFDMQKLLKSHVNIRRIGYPLF